MKKVIAIILSLTLTLTLSACGKKQDTTEPEHDEEDQLTLVDGKARVSGIKVLWKEAPRGTQIAVLGEEGDYYRAQLNDTQFLVEKRMVRFSTEAAPAEKAQYSNGTHQVYDSAFFDGKVIATLSLNDEVTVIDEFNGVSVVRLGNVIGYLPAGNLSSYQIGYTPKIEMPQAPMQESSGGNWSGGNSHRDPIEPTQPSNPDTPDAPSSPQDGGEIELSARVWNSSIILEAVHTGGLVCVAHAAEGTAAAILSDHVPLYLCITMKDEMLQIARVTEKTVEISVSGQIGMIPRWAVVLDGDAIYEDWTGYAVGGAKLFLNYDFTGETITLKTNDLIHVIYQIDEDAYLVEFGEVVGYMLDTNIKLEKMTNPITPETKSPSVVPDSNVGWSGAGFADSTPESGTSDDAEWTEPAL